MKRLIIQLDGFMTLNFLNWYLTLMEEAYWAILCEATHLVVLDNTYSTNLKKIIFCKGTYNVQNRDLFTNIK